MIILLFKILYSYYSNIWNKKLGSCFERAAGVRNANKTGNHAFGSNQDDFWEYRKIWNVRNANSAVSEPRLVIF